MVENTSAEEGAVRYATSSDLPAGHRVVVVQTPTGAVMVVREGKITPDLVQEIVQMHDALAACGMLGEEHQGG